MEDAITIFAHALLAAPFAASGVEKALYRSAGLKEVSAIERQTGLQVLPSLVLSGVIAVQLGGAILLMIPPVAAIGAMCLIGFLVPTTVMAHPFWRVPRAARAETRNHFLLNAGLTGGLLLVAGRSIS